MPLFQCTDISLQFPGSEEPLFHHLQLSIDSAWRCGIVGRNGRGKSTLLGLLHGTITPDAGVIHRPMPTALFTPPAEGLEHPCADIIKWSVAPFEEMERTMEQLLSAGDEVSLLQYQALFEEFQRAGGFTIDADILRECAELLLDEALLRRPFRSLSGGEQTRAMIAALFLKHGVLPLLDEPTNHLDIDGRALLAEYLARKQGFMVVSHDREFLDRCCDHMVAITRSGPRVYPGGYTALRAQLEQEERTEAARDRSIRNEVVQLRRAAEERRRWSMITEKEKHKAADSGFVSHKAAKMMKRALAVERRIDERLEEKESLLRNVETVRPLVLPVLSDPPEILVSLEAVRVAVGERTLIRSFDLTLRAGERVAIVGRNGTGKSTLLNIVRGTHPISTGHRRVPASVRLVSGYQTPRWERGMLRDHLRKEGIDETAFRTAMGTFTIQGGIFDRPLESFSIGERKKVDLCRSCIFPHHLLVWDEPVNYIDIESKEQVEAAILQFRPAMLFVEHDATFVRAVATRVIDLDVDRRRH